MVRGRQSSERISGIERDDEREVDCACTPRRDSNNTNNKIHISQLHARTGRCREAAHPQLRLHWVVYDGEMQKQRWARSEYIEFKFYPLHPRTGMSIISERIMCRESTWIHVYLAAAFRSPSHLRDRSKIKKQQSVKGRVTSWRGSIIKYQKQKFQKELLSYVIREIVLLIFRKDNNGKINRYIYVTFCVFSEMVFLKNPTFKLSDNIITIRYYLIISHSLLIIDNYKSTTVDFKVFKQFFT